MSVFPRAQIVKLVDAESHRTTGYQVAVMSDDEGPFAPGSFRTLRGVFRDGFRNALPPETKNILTEALKVAGPVSVTIGWWIEAIGPGASSRERPKF